MPRKKIEKEKNLGQESLFTVEKQNKELEEEKRKEENDRKAREGQLFHKIYNKNKAIIINLEKGNLQHLFILKSNKDYWKLFGTSALYYARVIARRHKRDVKVHIDKDLNPSYDGFVAIRDMKMFEEVLELEGAEYDNNKSPNEYIRAYRLKELISEDEIRGIRQKEKRERDKINEIIKTKEQFPDINFALNEFVERVVIEYRRAATKPQQRILEKLTDIVLDMKVNFRDMSNGILTKKEWYSEYVKQINHLEAYIDVIMETATLTMDSITVMVSLLAKLEQLVSEKRF